jgi:large subunit ribosomal protein L4
VNSDLIWESVVHSNAAERRGTHKAKNRALVSGSGKKPWRQKGTGRARVGSIRNPLWRHGGTVFPPQPRSYDFALPKKVERGALRAALAQKMKDGALVVVDQLAAAEIKSKAAVEMLAKLGVAGKTLLVDTTLDDKLAKSVRNVAGVEFVASGRVRARDVMHATKVVATRGAIEKLQEVLA